MRMFIRTLMAIAMMVLPLAGARAEDKEVKLGTLGWEDVQPITLITKKFLEQQGYKVNITTFSEWGIAFGALTKGDVELLVSHINYVTSDYWQRNKNRLEKVSPISYGLYQAFVVPRYMKIDSTDQLNSVRDQVDGKIIGIEPGSGLMRESAEAIKAYGLNYQLVEGSTAAMVAQLQSALDRREPIVTMLWDPSWMIQKFDVKFLKDPKNIFDPAQAYYWIAKRGFSNENPRVRELIASMFVPLSEISKINGDMKNGMAVDQAVDKWWGDHSDLEKRWGVIASQ